MKNANQLKQAMRPGRVYRRQELTGFTTAIDRDLKTLVDGGAIKKLSGGLYYRPRKNLFGNTPPADEELVKAFLKTDDFLLTSYNNFNQLGLGLTQIYNTYLVYNHKRSGLFVLGGKRFMFRLVSAYPSVITKEFLLVDLLNNLARLSDDTSLVLQNIKFCLNEFNLAAVKDCLVRYGRPAARTTFYEAYKAVYV